MSLTKQKTYSRTSVLALTLVTCASLIFNRPAPAGAHHAGDCSDVYTGLSSFVVDGVNRNKADYVAVMNQTGVPWEMLAAIHYRETGFSRSNPSNGYGIFQFTPPPRSYPPGPVSDAEFRSQLKYMADKIQSDYVYRNSPNAASVNGRKLTANEQDITLIKNTLYSYNGRATVYADQASHFGYNKSLQPYEGSPYVMNRFDCNRARMGLITQDYGDMDGTDTRYGAFTIFARLRGQSYWMSLQRPYYAVYVGQSSYPNLSPGQTSTAYIEFRNGGKTNWYDNVSAGPNHKKPIRLATMNPTNRRSEFGNSSWGSDRNRPTGVFGTVYQADGTPYTTNPHIVKPGESARFTFDITIPDNFPAGTYRERYALIEDGGIGPLPTYITPWIDVTVKEVMTATFVAQSAYPTLRGGEAKKSYITFKNTGNAIWFDNTSVGSSSGAKPVRLATVNPVNRASAFGTTSWGTGRNRPTGNFSVVYRKDGSAYPTNPHRVLPGESGRFEFTFTTPDNYTPGTYSEHFAPVHEGGSGIIPVNITPWLNLTVLDAPSAKALSTDHTTNINPLTTKTITYQFKNTGSTTWSQANTYLDVTNGEASKVRHSSWTSNSRVDRLNEATVAPGATGTFTVTYDAPQTGSKHNFKLAPSVSDQVVGLDAINVTLNVPAPTYQAKYWGQSPYPTVPQNTTKNVYFKFKNTGNIAWHDVTSAKIRGVRPVVLAATEPINRISKFNAAFPGSNRPAVNFAAVYESDGTTLASDQHVALPGQIIRYDFTLTVPHALSPGTYREWFQPIVEGGTPWSMDQTVFLNIKVIGGNQTAKFSGQSAFPTIAKGSSQGVFFKFKNTGNTSWHDVSSLLPGIRRVVLASTDPINRISKFNAAFPGSNRPAVNFAAVYESDGTTLASDQHIVKPGQIGRFNFTLTAPYDIASGTYREVFQPIVEGGTPWSMSQVAWLYVTVP